MMVFAWAESAGSEFPVSTHGLPSGAYLTMTGHFSFVRQLLGVGFARTLGKSVVRSCSWKTLNHQPACNFRDFTSRSSLCFPRKASFSEEFVNTGWDRFY